MPPDVLADALRAVALIAAVTVALAAVRTPERRARIAAWFRPPPPSPGEPPRAVAGSRRPAAIAVGILLALNLVGRLMPGSSNAFWVFDLGLAPIVQATGALAGFQLVASAAARGRAMPGVAWVPWIRRGLIALLALAGAAQVYEYATRSGGLAPGEFLLVLLGAVALVTVYAALCEASARAGGPSVAVAAHVAGGALGFLLLPSGMPGSRLAQLQTVVTLGSIGAVALALRRLGLGRERLRRLGITPFAPSELGLVPELVAGAVGVRLAMTWLVWSYEVYIAASITSTAAATLATIFALRYLDRRLREAEAFAAARAGAAASTQAQEAAP